ncbi:winged helix-turn-helix domain-containing protein [Chloroflexota bacterium]
MPRLLIVTEENKIQTKAHDSLNQSGFDYSITSFDKGIIEQVKNYSPDAILFEMNGYLPNRVIWETVNIVKQKNSLPVIASVNKERLGSINGEFNADDFIVCPYDDKELVLRVKKLLHKSTTSDSAEIIKCGNLVINIARCEVIMNGKTVDFTFREYELLKFLASNRGRVYTREALLDKVWGYDYYGGDRTVDVHIRRIRSKIEDSSHSFIETVRNIGYRFTKDL